MMGVEGPRALFFCNARWHFPEMRRRVRAVLAARWIMGCQRDHLARCPSKIFLPVAHSRPTKKFRMRDPGGRRDHCRRGRREQVDIPAAARRHDARAMTVAPILWTHIHGARHDVTEGTTEALATVRRTVARHGTTSLVATTIAAGRTDPPGRRRYRSMDEVRGRRAVALRRNPRVHFEGLSSALHGEE